MKTRTKYIIALVLLVLVITNPSVDALKDHLGKKAQKDDVSRTCNFFIFSFYEDTFETFRVTDRNIYFGILGNFFLVRRTYSHF